MSVKLFHELVGLDEAVKSVQKKIKLVPRGVEVVRVEEALYRVLAEDVYAPIDYPPFDRSEVDGYAVFSASVERATELNPVELDVKGALFPGNPLIGVQCDEKSAVQVSTGAPIPLSCDAVVMEEFTDRVDGKVLVYRAVSPGDGISTTGSDVSAGDLVLPRGVLIRHNHVALLAGLGIRDVPTYIKPRVAVYSTGVELREPGSPLPIGCVYDVNGFLVSSFLRELGAEAEYRGVLPDNYDVIRDAIARDLHSYDAVITSGGTSAGVSDVVYRVFEDIGEVLVHGLKSRPGKPTVIAVAGEKLLIGLPGFPLSAYMVLVRVVKPLISLLTGLRYYEKPLQVRLPFKVRKQIGIAWLVPSVLVESEKGLVAYPVPYTSGSISAIAYSEGFVELGEEQEVIEEGQLVSYYPFREAQVVVKLIVIGSNDPLLEHILRETGLIYASKVLNAGSLGGWEAIRRGEADIAPTHLYDPETGSYNTPFLKRLGLEDKAIVIRGYDRLIGFVVAKDNPKSIRGFECFFREDVRIVNRTRGSGIRSLIDYNLSRIARDRGIDAANIPRLVRGYTYEVKTHTAVGYAVKVGKADVGVAVGYVAKMYDLDFIPIGWEEFDFVVLKERVEKPLVQDFIHALRQRRYTEGFRYPEYYRIPENSGFTKTH